MRLRPLAIAFLVFGVALASPAVALADASAEDRAQSEALFESAQALYKAGRYADALPKLVESNRLDPAAGTMLYIGECYAQLGKTASAWSAFQDALDFATRTGNAARADQARQRVADL